MAIVKIVGERTQNHDQAMTFVSFSTIKAIVKRDVNPIPLEELEELAINPSTAIGVLCRPHLVVL